MEPMSCDWELVGSVRVKVERGSLRFRFGTTDARKNLNFNAHDKKSGPPWWPGKPIFWPADYTAQAGDPERETFIMPLQIAFDCFGWWNAPLEEDGLTGFTLTQERARVAAFWGGYRMPKGDGTMHPPMNRLGPPIHMPHVAITLLDRQMRPLKDENGQEYVIRPREFYDFDNMSQYDEDPNATPAAQASLIEGLTSDELGFLRDLVKEMRAKRNVKAS
jgi:hypothetical protein